jgi:hypothetical protein
VLVWMTTPCMGASGRRNGSGCSEWRSRCRPTSGGAAPSWIWQVRLYRYNWRSVARLRDECCSRGRIGSPWGWECGCRASSLAFFRLAHSVPCVRYAPARGGVVVVCWVAWRFVRAVGGGCPLRGADRRRTNRGVLPLTLISVSHTSTL